MGGCSNDVFCCSNDVFCFSGVSCWCFDEAPCDDVVHAVYVMMPFIVYAMMSSMLFACMLLQRRVLSKAWKR